MASATENRYINLYINGKQAGRSLAEIRKNYRRLSAEINRGEFSQKEYNQRVAELRRYKSVLDAHSRAVRGVGGAWSRVKDIILGVVGGAGIMKAIQMLVRFIPDLVNHAAKLSDAFADVRKTTDLSAEGMEDLNRRLRTINTRTARAELLELAKEAGKMNIQGAHNIAEFVKAADQINVALGEDLGEGAVRQLGKLNNLFGISDIYGVGDGLLRIGSVINELGVSSEAQEGSIVDFTSRLAGVATQADISYQSIAGIGATLDALGQRTETSATAVSQAIVGMFKDTDTYAKVAGMGVEEFSGLLNRDANAAFTAFLKGLNGNNEGLSVMAQKFTGLGLNGNRAITVLSALAGNTDMLAKQQDIANQAFAEGTSLTNEFNLRNDNLAGNLEKVRKRIYAIWSNSAIKNAIDGVVRSMAEMVEVPVSENLEEQRRRFGALMGALQNTQIHEENRKAIIDQLNESYGDRLGYIDLEKASLDELRQAMARVNDQYVVEIALMKAKERVKEAEKKRDQAEARQMSAEVGRGAALNKARELAPSLKDVPDDEVIAYLEDRAKYETVVMPGGGPQISQAANDEALALTHIERAYGSLERAQRAFTRSEEELTDAMGQQATMVEILKESYPELAEIIDRVAAGMKAVPGGGGGGGGDEDGGGDTPFTPAAADPGGEKKSPFELRLEEIKQAAEEEMLYLEQHRAEQLIDAELFEEEMLSIKLAYLYLELEARKQMDDDAHARLATERAIAKEEIRLHEMIAKRAEAAAKAKEKAAEAEKAVADAKAKAEKAAALAAVESAAQRGAAAVSAAETEYEAAVAAINIIRQLIKEYVLEAVIAAVAKEVSSKGLLGVITGAVAAGAVSFLFDKLIPPVKMPPKPAFARGVIGYGGSAIVGEEGREEILMPPGASVVPADITQRLLAAQAFSRPTPVPTAAMAGMNFGQAVQEMGSAGGGSAAVQPVDMAPLLEEIRAMRAELRRMGDRKVTLAYRDFLDFQKKYDAANDRVVVRSR